MMKYGSEGLCPHCEHCESCPHSTKDIGASIQVCTGGFIAMSPSASFEPFTIKVKGFKPRFNESKDSPVCELHREKMIPVTVHADTGEIVWMCKYQPQVCKPKR